MPRKLAGLAAVATMTIAGLNAAAGSAHADGNCIEDYIGAYYCGEYNYAPLGTVRMVTQLIGGHEYAQAVGWVNSSNWAVYMDVSTNGGATWNGWQKELDNQPGTLTDSVYDGSGYLVRACITDYHNYACTSWH